MKLKYLFARLMLIILVCSVASIAADEDYGSLGDYTFDIPAGYEIVNKTDNLLSMQQDTDHAIVMALPDEVKSADEFKADLEKQGYEFGDEGNYTIGNFEINQYNYNKDTYQGFLYICDDGNDSPILITLVIPADEDAPDPDNNPVTEIVNSLE